VRRAPLPHLVALVCGLLVALAAGCGSDRSNLIPQSRASDLTQQLADIKAAVDAGECDGLSAKVESFHDDATSLQKPVDTRLRKRINDGVAALQEHAVPDCETARDAQETETTDTTETETVPPETTTTTTTTETQTVAPETTTTTAPSSATPSSGTPPGTATDPGTGDGSGDGGTIAPDVGGTPGEETP
jgi:hypothetical protein